MIERAKTKYLFQKGVVTPQQEKNTDLNLKEIDEHKSILESYPRRLVLELTNACNLNCIMCGRNTASFKPTFFKLDWLKKFENLLDTIEETALFGWGEPTVHPEFVQLLEYLDRFDVRKYFCTNGMKLDVLKDDIFKYHVDIIAISVDGATEETNNKIRRGSDLKKIVNSLKDIVNEKKEKKLSKPYMNFVFCAMKSNIHELPQLVELTADIGLEEVKVVYLTTFDENLTDEVLWNKQDLVKDVFDKSIKLAEKLGVAIKLPYIQGEDVAGDKYHKDCFVGWRDLFLGSDGFIRPCMSTPIKFFNIHDYDNFNDMWNNPLYQEFRKVINDTDNMPSTCKTCYQSSHCNWNNKESYIQIGKDFAPKWEK